MSATTVLEPQLAPPSVIHSCPNCSHWLPDGTLACPDCQTLTYGRYLSELAGAAQQLEQQGRWQEARERWNFTLQWLPENTQQAASIQQHIAGIDGRLGREQSQRERWTRRLGPFTPIALFLLKAKSAVFLLFKLKFLFGLVTFFGLYWVMFGWQFAVGFTACIFIHEMGHYVAVKRRGLRADLPMFFPGLGAYVRWYSQGISREDLASIALAGPLYGLIAALACFGLYGYTHNELFLVLANVGAWINVFNLMPLTMLGLDGAQATFALSKLQRGLIAATCVVFFALTANNGNTQWVLLLVGLMMGWRAMGQDMPEKQDTRIFAYFLGLVLALGMLMYRTAALVALMPKPPVR